MPLKKIIFKPGVNRENTRYTTEGGWYDCDKIRFRYGTPEKIGGWERISGTTYLGIARSMWPWSTIAYSAYLGVGTNLKYYIMYGGAYYDITPIATTTAAGAITFAATNGSSTVAVNHTGHGATVGTSVTYSGVTSPGGLGGNITEAVLEQEYQITSITSANAYTITAKNPSTGAAVTANASDTGNGGASVVGAYQVSAGPAEVTPLTGWGAGAWGSGAWGTGVSVVIDSIRVWNAQNFGEDLIYGPQGGALYYWNATTTVSPPIFTVTIASPGVITTTISLLNGTAVQLLTTGALPTGLLSNITYYVVNSTGTSFSLAATPGGTAITTSGTQSGEHTLSVRGIPLTSLIGASDVPQTCNLLIVSDTSRFVLAFGCPDYGSSTLDPMLIRWSDQESAVNWTPAATNQAGSVRLSHGSRISGVAQVRQEILVWTDTSLYSLQYLGPPIVWGSQLLTDNISLASDRAMSVAAGVTYWMGDEKFYMYDGRVQTLPCDLRQYIFTDFNYIQTRQVFCSTIEQFNEVWWFYCSANSNTVDRYVVFNYIEKGWYYGTLARTAWVDASVVSNVPIAATYINNLVYHETGVDDNATGTPQPITSYITSSEFDIDDGHNFGFVWRVLPDVTFRGSTAASPSATLTLLPLQNSGSGYTRGGAQTATTVTQNMSVAGQNSYPVARIATVPIEQFTGQVNIRVRGRQMSMKMASDGVGVQWQLGAPRIDVKQDGRKS